MKSWCKVASNLDSHPKIRKAGRLGREVFLFALRRNAEPDNPMPGYLPFEMLEPWYVADQLMMSEAEAVTGVTAAVTAGLLIHGDEVWVIAGWDDEWGKAPVAGAERTKRWRESKRLRPTVTTRDARDVTESHGDGGDALDKTRGEETRGEEKRKNPDSDTLSAVGSVSTSKPRSRKRKSAEPTDIERATAMRVLARLGQRNDVQYTGAAEHIRLIVHQLRAGVSELELRAIGGYCQEFLGWGGEKPEMAKHLRPETLYGPQTISRYLDPARSWASEAIAAEQKRLQREAAQPALELVP